MIQPIPDGPFAAVRRYHFEVSEYERCCELFARGAPQRDMCVDRMVSAFLALTPIQQFWATSLAR